MSLEKKIIEVELTDFHRMAFSVLKKDLMTGPKNYEI